MSRLLPPTSAPFRAWLASLDPETTVGYANSACRCPLAVFVGPYSAVGRNSYYAPDLGGQPSPHWASRFIDRADALGRNKEVLAAQALALLDEAEAQ